MGEDEKTKMLGLMRYWLFGTFVIVFAATTIYAGGVWGTGLEILKQPNYWYGMAFAAVMCVAWYYVYRWYLTRK
ncbi:MAG TPA: hypothetical protein VMN57_06605 [Anaerolineales bacterium]|nr:hypothetical protein [Anaerolineales bacterium]